jgi:hypothetical protein
MMRPVPWVALVGCGLAGGCAPLLDYDALTSTPGRDAATTGEIAPGDALSPDASDGSTGMTSEPPRDAGSASEGGAVPEASVAFDGEAGVDSASNVDPCSAVSSLFNGRFCGSDTQWSFDSSAADPNTLYTCTDGHTTSAVTCPDGCMVAPPTSDDSCNP